MKYFIFVTSILVSTHSMVAMDNKDYYQKQLDRIAAAAQGQPSITLINNTPFPLSMEIGDIEKDGIKSGMTLRKKTELTFSPFTHPFNLKEEGSKRGITIPLTCHTEKESRHNLHVGGISPVKFGDTIHVNYDNDNNIIRVDHDNKKTGIRYYSDSMYIGTSRVSTLRTKSKNQQRSMKRSSTFSS